MHPKPENTAIKHKTTRLLTDTVFYLAILFFIIGFNFSDRMAGNWYQQFMPTGLPNFQLSDITFLDSLTGFAVTGNGSPNDSSGYILKTTDAGDNWVLKYAEYRDFSRVKFINSNTGFVSGGYFDGARIYKTTNAGENWFPNNIPGGGQIFFNDMQVISEDTIWVVAENSLVGGVFFTSNGGASWVQQLNLGSQNPNHIYIYNNMLGFICRDNTYLRRTTDGGNNWNTVPGAGGFTDMYFADNLTGWKTSFQKTTNGGLNWVNQVLPQGGNIITTQIVKFMNLGTDTIWGVGGHVFLPGQGNRGMIYRTINSGNNWLFQIPDTGINIGVYSYTDFYDKYIGWAYSTGPGVHTTIGGDPLWLTPISQTSTEVPQDFTLYQNYPNPFNPNTVIGYEISRTADVSISVYDIQGKLVKELVSQKHTAGTYEVDFNGNGYASGVYFYRIEVTDNKSKKVFSETKKMVLLK